MSETLATIVIAAIGILFLCLASVVLALKTKGDRSISWSGFGVVFRVGPCRDCPVNIDVYHKEGGAS